MSDNILSIGTLKMQPEVAALPAQPRPASPARVKSFLDRTAAALRDPARAAETWPRLLAACAEFREGVPEEEWRGRLRTHPVFEVLRAEPATGWSYRKPRGHAGDARLMDYLYDHPAIQAELEAAAPHGRALHRALLSGPTATAARASRTVMARALDDAAASVRNARVLVLGAGHLREAELAGRLDRLGQLVVVDQDPACADEVRRGPAGRGNLQTVTASVRRLAIRPDAYGRFDLILAAGLLDYLDDATAAQVLRALVPVLRQGGRMLFSNARPGTADEAYMDAFMDWRMFRRDEDGMRRLLQAGPRAARTSIRTEDGGALLYATVEAPGA